jgi:hypothetical protein
MSPPARFFRLFDTMEYKRIEHVLKGINDRTASSEQIVELINRALEVAETDEFKNNNYNPNGIALSSYVLREMLNLINAFGVSMWPGEMICCDPLGTIVRLICCPGYRETSRLMKYSNTNVDYTEFCGYTYSFTEELHNALDLNYNSGFIYSDIPHSMKIFDSQKLTIVTKLISAVDLSKIACNLTSEERTEVIDFYEDLKCLVGMANSQPYYSILDETEGTLTFPPSDRYSEIESQVITVKAGNS